MVIRRFEHVIWSVALGSSVLAYAEVGAACSPPPPGYQVSAETPEVPVGGVLVASLRCYSSCPDTTPAITVVDEDTGEPVAGTSEVLEGEGTPEQYHVWTPSVALTEGKTYRIAIGEDDEYTTDDSFLVVPAATLDPEAVEVEANVTLSESLHGEQTCCDDFSSSCGPNPFCFAREVKRDAMLSLLLRDTTQPALGQFTKHVTFTTSSGSELSEVTTYNAYASQLYGRAAAEYCYQIELISLVDETRHVLPRTCVPHGGAGPTGVFAVSDATLDEQVQYCLEPPEGYEEIWCGRAERLCSEGNENACRLAEADACDEPGGAGGSGGVAGSGGGQTGGTGGGTAGTGGSAGSPTTQEPSDDDSGCSIGSAPARGSSSAWAGIGLGLALALRLGRRRSART